MIELINGDCTIEMQKLKSDSADVILTDPPYLYLKNQKLDRPFNEKLYFSEVRRILKDSGFIVLFGRGSSFYRWNTRLADLGFIFKEEIVWNKRMNSSPVTPISRIHETISIHTKKSGVIYKSKVPYTEMKQFDILSLANDFKRAYSALKNTSELDRIVDYLESGSLNPDTNKLSKHETTVKLNKTNNSGAQVVKSMCEGMKEKSIIEVSREHYKMIHPTQKPYRLIERLLHLVSKEGDYVVDTFAGSGSTGKACFNLNRNFTGYEIDEEFFQQGLDLLIECQNGKLKFGEAI